MFNVFSYKFNLLNKRAYKYIKTRYNVVKKTQNDVFREYVLQLNSVKKQVITRLSGYAMKRSFIY